MEMNFDQMVLAHSKWKARLKSAIEDGEAIDPNVAGRDDQCELGKWIYGDGLKHGAVPAYQELRDKHKAFHACVGQVARKLPSCSPMMAKELIDPIKSDFGRATSACIVAIGGLKAALAPK